jgi:mercuric ion transport protein
MGTALLACPCHLIFLLPAVLGLLGGTALGAALEANTGLIVAAATVYFFGALAGGIYLMNRRGRKQ